MTTRSTAAVLAIWGVLAAPSAFAGLGEVRLLSAGALKDAITEAAPAFERECGCKLVAQFGQAGALKKRIDGGEAFDVVVLPAELAEQFARDGKIAGAVAVARSGLGFIVKAGAPKPDVGSEDALRRALLQARAISVSKEGASAEGLKRIIDKLGIAAEMQPKLMPVPLATDSVKNSESDMGLVVISALAPNAGVDVVGALPAQLQSWVNFSAGASAAAGDVKAADAFVKFLRSPAATAALKTKQGLEPAP